MRAKSNVIVVDLGSINCKAGFAGEDTPRSIFPTMIGNVKNYDPKTDETGKDFIVGNMQNPKIDPSTIRSPFKNGLIAAKEDITKLYSHIFDDELHVESEKRSIVMSEPIETTKETRTCYAEVLFETFHVPSIFIASSPLLALYSTCQTVGIVLDVGDSYAQVSSIYEWTQMPQTLIKNDLSGSTISKFFQNCLKDSSYQFSGASGLNIARQIKERVGFVSPDYELSLSQDGEKTMNYQIGPDSVIKIGKERFMCPEVLFKPNLMNLDCDSIPSMIYESFMRSDIGLRKELLQNVVLSSGTTLLKGFEDRLKKELMTLFEDQPFNINASPKRLHSVWIGGSIVGSLALFPQMVVTRDEYREVGPTALMRRFY